MPSLWPLLLAASATFGPADVQPLVSVGDRESWAKAGYLGESPDGRVALVLEQGESDTASELKVTVAVIDSTGRQATEKIEWSTTDPEQLDPLHAWEAQGAQIHTLLERAGIKVGFKRFSADEAKKPKGLDFQFESDPQAAGSIEVRLGAKTWFRTEPKRTPRLTWKGVLHTSKGALHLFALQRLGAGSGPELELLARALPAATK